MIIAAGIAAGVLSLVIANMYLVKLTDDSAKATVAAGEITLFGVIFSAIYKEISEYYQERSANLRRKWDLVFPYIKNHYIPWINSAKSLRESLDYLTSPVADDAATRVLYLTLLFYGYRHRFILQDGGLILLSTTADQNKVEISYRTGLVQKYQWAQTQTPLKVSYLQTLFRKKEWVYTLDDFARDLPTDPKLVESRKTLESWLDNAENVKGLKAGLDDFINTFMKSIEKLYTAWGS